MELIDIRRANARALFEKVGGAAKVSRAMGYTNPSFLTQMFGPNPKRPPSEKTMRKMEQVMGLPVGVLDQATGPALPQKPTAVGPLDVGTLSQMIALVGRVVQEESVALSPDRFASLVSLAYEDAARGEVREGRVRQMVQLLR